MNKDIPNDLGELPSINDSGSSNSSGGLDKLMKSFNENKLQIVAFLSFFLFIIFTMSLVLGSVDFTEEEGEKAYSGNKSLDKLYEEADGNEALSNARMTSKIDLSTDDYSCSYFVEYEGNDKRNVYCTSCPDSIEDDVTENDKFCRQFVYGDSGEFEYALLDNEYVSQRRARKESEADRQFAEGDLPECTRTSVDESKLVGTAEERKEQICDLDTSRDSGSNLERNDCSEDDIEEIRNLKYELKCDCSKFSNTNQDDCNDNDETHKCEIVEGTCKSATEEIDREGTNRWYLFKLGATLFSIFTLILFIIILLKFNTIRKNKERRDLQTFIFTGAQIILTIIFSVSIYNYLSAWKKWAEQYKNDDKQVPVVDGYNMKLLRHQSYWLYLFWPIFSLILYGIASAIVYVFTDTERAKNIGRKIWKNGVEILIILLPIILAGTIVFPFILGDDEDIEDDTDDEGIWPFNHLEKPKKDN